MSNRNEIHRAYELGQSFWLDYIRRDLLEDGELAGLIQADEIRGVTSNPSIFQQAIADSDLYNAAMRPMAHAGWSAERIFEALAVEDIRAATDLFLPLYEGTDGRDGFVSIEVNPELAADTQKTLEEARRIWEWVNRPNLMVKIPATPEGVPAIEQAIFEGININVTLIFSLERYSEVMEAYIEGLERRAAAGESLDRVASVASFFVSRVDVAVDRRLEAIIRDEGLGAERALALLGKAAIANVKLAYAQFKAVFEGARFASLEPLGGRLQRPLWASTSTKNSAYSDVRYVDELVGPYTVNTVPPKTLKAFREHGKAALSLEQGLSDSRAQLEALETVGISMNDITLDLEKEGVQAFARSYAELIDVVKQRAHDMRDELGTLAPEVAAAIEKLESDRAAARFWRFDPTLWNSDLSLEGRLSWLNLAMQQQVEDARQLGRAVGEGNFAGVGWLQHSAALGALRAATDSTLDHNELETLDPGELRSFAKATPIDSTLFVVAGSEVESFSKLLGAWERAEHRAGGRAGSHFVALTRPASPVERHALRNDFRLVIYAEEMQGPPIGELEFAQVAALGGDPQDLVEGAARMKVLTAPGTEAARNAGLYLGAVMAAASNAGLRLSLAADPEFESLAGWLAEQVRARIRLPVEVGIPDYGARAVVYLRVDGKLDGELTKWIAARVPVAILEIENSVRGLGAEAVRWEMATGIAAHLLKDKWYAAKHFSPATERLSKMVRRFEKKGDFGISKPQWDSVEAEMWWNLKGSIPEELNGAADSILDRLEAGSPLYLGIYHKRSSTIERELTQLTKSLASLRRIDCVSAFGALPRADLHWGLTLLVGVEPNQDDEIPELDMTYGALQHAAMLAEYEQLKKSDAQVCAIRLKSPFTLSQWLGELRAASERSANRTREGSKASPELQGS